MNYSELTTAIESYLQNDFSPTEMSTFVKQAEQRIYNSIQFSYLRKNVTGTLTTNNKYLSAPADFLSVYSMAVVKANGEYQYLINKDVNFIREVYPSPTSTGLPKYYGIFGPTVVTSTITDELSFIVGPTPDSGYAVELHYYYYPESIVDAGTSWLGDNVDSVLLYGALVEAYTFLKGEPDLVQLYDTKYKEALMLAKQLGDGKQRGDAYRDGQVKYPVK
jgi:hypothetical protein